MRFLTANFKRNIRFTLELTCFHKHRELDPNLESLVVLETRNWPDGSVGRELQPRVLLHNTESQQPWHEFTWGLDDVNCSCVKLYVITQGA